MWEVVRLPGPWAASSQGVMLVVGSARKQRSQWCSLSSYLSGSLWLLGKEELEDSDQKLQILSRKIDNVRNITNDLMTRY